MISQRRLKELLSYDPETGEFVRLTAVTGAPKGSIAGCRNTSGYLVIRIDGKLHYAHRLAWLYMTGELPAERIDHANRFRADNRWENLREASHSDNLHNTGPSRRNTSGVKGVCWHKQAGKWAASIMSNRTAHYLGLFEDKESAAQAVQAKERELHGMFSVAA